VVLVTPPYRWTVALAATALVALAAPAGLGVPWWSASIFDLAVAAGALWLALRPLDAGSAAAGPLVAGPIAGSAAAGPLVVGPIAGTADGAPAAAVDPPTHGGAAAGSGPVVVARWWPRVAVPVSTGVVAVGYGRPGIAAATLAAVTLLGVGAAVAGRRLRSDRTVGGVALAIGMLAVPPAAAAVAATLTTASSWPATATWQGRAALGAAVLVTAVAWLVAWRWSAYRTFALAAALLVTTTAPLWAIAGRDPVSVYAGIALVLIAVTATTPRPTNGAAESAESAGGFAGSAGSAAVPGSVAVPGPAAVPGSGASGPLRGRHGKPDAAGELGWAAAAAILPGVVLIVSCLPSVLTVLAAPYGWLVRVWAGRPVGTGLDRVGIDPAGVGVVSGAAAAALLMVAVATAIVVHAGFGRRPAPGTPDAWRADAGRAAAWAALPAVAVALPVALAAAGAPWPTVPAVTLAVGLAVALAVALVRPSGRGTSVLLAMAAATVGAGLAGMLPTPAATLAGLGAVAIAGATAGTAGRELTGRLVGWLVAVGAGIAFAYTAGRAADLSLPDTALGVLAAAAVALAFGSYLAGRRRVEGVAVQAAAHAGATLALLLTVGSARYAAAVCTLWGVVIGVRALRPGERAGRRRILVVAAAGAELSGWWLLVAAERVSLIEAYTLPAAAVALLAGWLALRSRPELTSWVAYGPALAAALLPTLASVLVGDDGQLLRRLLLGVGALAVVLLGAATRLQAPVVVGGVVLLAVALHELALVWELVPRWIPLAAVGLLLVGLAMTLERRRRDLARVRSAVGRMS
jgi:hypothetical protein